MLLKCCTTYVSKFGKLSSGHRTEVSFHDNPKEGQSQNCSNYHTVVLISHTNKVMLKILQFRLQQYMNRELPDVLGLRKGRGTRDQIVNIHWIMEKAREFQKSIYFFTDCTKAFVCLITNCGKFLKRREYQTSYLSPEKPVWGSRKKQQSETRHGATDWFQIGKGVWQGCIIVTLLI